ncbi:bactofilin family protein [Haloarchaeobius sp. HRN-SO-5]|uniref:bactofilin family protein n=1 Tax=Haloarchaeobius sp. HRN-SO-5 TaxID=3446118 RepID=UPI003EBAAC01
MSVSTASRRILVSLMVLVVVLGSVPGLVAAESAVAGSYVVEEGETVDGLDVLASTVVVRGTVNGDLNGAAADVRIEDTGVVTGDLNVAAASVDIAGRVDGDVSVGAATLRLLDGAVVGGQLNVGAADVTLAGTVRGDAAVGADVISVTDSAVVGGDLRYDGDLRQAEGASVGGSVVRDETIGQTEFDVLPAVTDWVLAVYGFFVNFLLGAVLLLVLPGFSRQVADRVADSPLESGGVGLLTVVAVPVALVLVALTIVGIPITLVGAGLFALVAWVAVVYGRFALGSWLVARAGGENRWVALTVGLLLGALFDLLGWVGGVFDGAVFLLGLGALVLVLYDRYVGGRERRAGAPGAGEEDEVGGVPPA